MGLVVGTLCILLLCGCAAEKASVGSSQTYTEMPRKVPVRYICGGCGKKINREGVELEGFIAKCPSCGKQFLTM